MKYRDDKELDNALRSLAKSERLALPEDLDERLSRCLGVLPEKKEKEERPVKTHTRKIVNRIILAAAVLALMIACLAVGALAFSQERVVEVPVARERQEIVMEDIGLTVVLPDSWKDRYFVKSTGSECVVYCKAVTEYDRLHGDETALTDPKWGCLFAVRVGSETPMTPEEFAAWTPVPALYLFSTENGTYSLGFPSDVQVPSPVVGGEYAREAYDEYTAMFEDISSIRFDLAGVVSAFDSGEIAGSFEK